LAEEQHARLKAESILYCSNDEILKKKNSKEWGIFFGYIEKHGD
jgi:hypothetical protein